MRLRLPLPPEPYPYNFISLDRHQFKELRNAAHTFDVLTAEHNKEDETPERRFTAAEFLDWIVPDMEPRKPKVAV